MLFCRCAASMILPAACLGYSGPMEICGQYTEGAKCDDFGNPFLSDPGNEPDSRSWSGPKLFC